MLQLNIYYDAITAYIKEAGSILIFGSGEAKNTFSVVSAPPSSEIDWKARSKYSWTGMRDTANKSCASFARDSPSANRAFRGATGYAAYPRGRR